MDDEVLSTIMQLMGTGTDGAFQHALESCRLAVHSSTGDSGTSRSSLMEEGGSRRVQAATAAIESVGGSLDCFYYAFGETDVYGICDFPDEASATAFSLMVNASGTVEVSMTPLVTAEDLDAAAAKTPSYRPPGS